MKTKSPTLFYKPESSEISLGESEQSRVFTMLNHRWSLMVLRELSFGRQRFNELSKRSNINPYTLRDRLREMESLGLVDRYVVSSHPPRVEYNLTPKGVELCQVFGSLDNWAIKYAAVDTKKVQSKKRK